jgi:hypothetical protein
MQVGCCDAYPASSACYLLSRLFLAWLHARPKCRLTFNGLRAVIYQKMELLTQLHLRVRVLSTNPASSRGDSEPEFSRQEFHALRGMFGRECSYFNPQT